jgi:hypothetical protein
MDYVHCPRCKCAYNVITFLRCPACPAPVEMAAPRAATAEGSGPIVVAPILNATTIPFSERAKAAAGWVGRAMPANGPANANVTAPVTAIVAPDPIGEMMEAAGMLMRAASRMTARELVGAVSNLKPRAIAGAMMGAAFAAVAARAPRWLRS